MLYLLVQFSDQINFLNLFKYQSFRAGGAVMTALIVAFMTGPSLIRWLRSKQKTGQPIRLDGPESHLLTKVGTPTMGGVMILLSLFISTLLWADLSKANIWILLLVTGSYGLIGFIDDYLKVSKRNTKGLPGKAKLLGQGIIALVAVFWLITLDSGRPLPGANISPEVFATSIAIPFFKNFLLNLGWFYALFAAFVIVGSSNAVNLTDGLDGLATVPIMIAAGVFGIIAYMVGRTDFSEYLQLNHVPYAGELSIFCAALIGAGMGFLWFNAPPATVFMGDTGSLAMGGALGTISVITKHEIVLAVVGGLFVLEAVSVIVQVASFKLTGRRVFRMAPLHHHFEKKGWKEPTIVIRFWIIAAILALIGLSTLKLR